jgi:hypothetical protein
MANSLTEDVDGSDFARRCWLPVPTPSQVYPIDSFMADFRLSDEGEIERWEGPCSQSSRA